MKTNPSDTTMPRIPQRIQNLSSGLRAKLQAILPGFRISISRTWMISYLVVLIVPLLISQMFYYQSVRLAEENASEVCDIALEQTLRTLEQALIEVRAAGRELLTSEEAVSLQYMDSLNAAGRLRVAELNKSFQRKLNYSNCMDKLLMIFTRSGVAASSEGFYTSEAVLSQQLSTEWGLDYDQVMEAATSSGDFHLILTPTGGDGYQVADEANVVMDVDADGVLPGVILVVRLNMPNLSDILAGEGGESQPVVWAMSDDGQLVIPSGIDNSWMQQLVEQTGPYLTERNPRDAIAAESLIVGSLRSELTGWQLVSATPTAFYSDKLSVIQLWYLIYLVACLGVGGIISFVFTRKNFSPLRRLASLLHEEKGGTEEGIEFQALEDGVCKLLEKERDYEREIEKRRKSLRSTSLVQIMKGIVYSGEAFRGVCRDYGMTFDGDGFSVVGIDIRDYSNLFFDGKATQDEKTRELAEYVVISVTEEMIRESYTAYLSVSENRLYGVISVSAGQTEEEYQEKLCGICRRAETFIRERLGIRLQYYITGLYRIQPDGDADENAALAIHQAYEEAQWGLEQVIGFEVTDPVTMRRTLPHTRTEQGYDFSGRSLRRRQYVAAVGAGDFEEADKLYLQLREDGIYQFEHSFSSVRAQTLMLFELLVTSHLSTHQITEQEQLLSKLSGGINKARDLRQLQQAIRRAEETIYALRHPQDAVEEEPYSVRVGRYIEAHYMDPGLSVASIAEHFQISQSYLLRAFKKDGSGCSVSDYIHRRRVDEAKILLKSTDKTVGEIAAAVGYGNALALIRAFKRLENGLTPTSYRSTDEKKQ